MRHRKAGLKLNRTSSHRKAMFRNMVTSLFKYERIRTTDTKAKELRRWADRLITLAKCGDLHARRQALSIIREKNIVHKLFNEAPERFGTISGGYTRITKIGWRRGDAAAISMIELVAKEKSKKKITKKKEKADTGKKEAAEKKSVIDEKKETPEDKLTEESLAETITDSKNQASAEVLASDVTETSVSQEGRPEGNTEKSDQEK